MRQRLFIKKRFAFNGLKILLKEEHNARLHVLAAVCVVVAGFAA